MIEPSYLYITIIICWTSVSAWKLEIIIFILYPSTVLSTMTWRKSWHILSATFSPEQQLRSINKNRKPETRLLQRHKIAISSAQLPIEGILLGSKMMPADQYESLWHTLCFATECEILIYNVLWLEALYKTP